jgi:beta-glucosidase
MVAQLGDRLPTFTPAEAALVKGSNDFYGMNHYTANYIKHKPTPADPDDFLGNLETLFESKNGDNIGPETQSFWLRPNPPGFRALLGWLSKRYGYPKIYVTENGTSLKGENDLAVEELLDDEFRAEYFRSYIAAMAEAVEFDGVDVQAYMAWSLLGMFPRPAAELIPADTAFLEITLSGPRASRRASALRLWIMRADRRDILRNQLVSWGPSLRR